MGVNRSRPLDATFIGSPGAGERLDKVDVRHKIPRPSDERSGPA
jgi:hypothetical protein